MNIAIMQPYIFPYIGYFQLVRAADHFVFYDDVGYIKGGWINRNHILSQGKAPKFTIPLAQASSFKTICETQVDLSNYPIWSKKFIKTLQQSYGKAPEFDLVFSIIEDVLRTPTQSIAEIAENSVRSIADYLQFETEYSCSSMAFNASKGLGRGDRLINIVKELKGDIYLNPSGGEQLYTKEFFEGFNIQLKFLEAHIGQYHQFGKAFVPRLSIIDVLMFNNKEKALKLIDLYSLN